MSAKLILALSDLLVLERSVLAVVSKPQVARNMPKDSGTFRTLRFAHNWQRLLEFKAMMYSRLRDKSRPVSIGEVLLLKMQIKECLCISQIHAYLPKALRIPPKFLEFKEPSVQRPVSVPEGCSDYALRQLKTAYDIAQKEMFKRMRQAEVVLTRLFQLEDPGSDQYLVVIVKVISYDYRVVHETEMEWLDPETKSFFKRPISFYAGHMIPLRPSQYIVLDSYIPYALEFCKLNFEEFIKPLLKAKFIPLSYTVEEYLRNEGYVEQDFSTDLLWEQAKGYSHTQSLVPF
jgi:hypothetical protein